TGKVSARCDVTVLTQNTVVVYRGTSIDDHVVANDSIGVKRGLCRDDGANAQPDRRRYRRAGVDGAAPHIGGGFAEPPHDRLPGRVAANAHHESVGCMFCPAVDAAEYGQPQALLAP